MTIVIVRCDEHIGGDPTYRQPWSDVLISFADSHGEARVFDLTLLSLPTLEQDIAGEQRKLSRDAERDQTVLKRLERSLEALRNGAAFSTDATSPDDVLTLYSPAPYLDKAEAEKLLRLFLASLGIPEVELQWTEPTLRWTVGPV